MSNNHSLSKKKNDDIQDFDTSIILAFYKKMKEFRRVLPLNATYFQRNGIEVIIALDEPTECEELIEFIKKYPGINWRVILNRKYHEWRNPCKALNVAIRHATKKYILVLDPESEFYSDVIYQLRQAADTEKNSFFLGKVSFVGFSYLADEQTSENLPFTTYGSILAKKSDIEAVCGYTESFNIWGGDDDNLRAKLVTIGIEKKKVPNVFLLHREESDYGFELRAEKSALLPQSIINKAYTPDEQDFINPNWGRDFSEIYYDYLNAAK